MSTMHSLLQDPEAAPFSQFTSILSLTHTFLNNNKIEKNIIKRVKYAFHKYKKCIAFVPSEMNI